MGELRVKRSEGIGRGEEQGRGKNGDGSETESGMEGKKNCQLQCQPHPDFRLRGEQQHIAASYYRTVALHVCVLQDTHPVLGASS